MDTSNLILKAPATSKAQDMVHKIHVLLVDHDINAHAPIVDMFEYFSYKVTSVKLASSAVSLLAKGKIKFDLLVENIKSPDACGYKLLQIALLLDMPVILLLGEDDLVFTKRALETGVLLCIKKPVPVAIARYLWQLVARETIRKEKEMGRFREQMTPKRLHNEHVKSFSGGNTSLGESHKSKKKMKYSGNAIQEDNTIVSKRKIWTDWTEELHERFVYATRMLGEGRCYPRDILDLMNVPGLTRMQVASHLQKCRRGTWVHPAERKPKITAPMPTSGKTSNAAKSKRHGSIPPLVFNPQPLADALKNIENDQDQVPMMDSSKGDNVLGCDSEGVSQEVCNPFSFEATKMEQAFDMDDVFMPEEKSSIDAQNVAPTANTSLGDQSSVTDEFFEFPNMDIMIQSFYASEQVPMDDAGSCDLSLVYSSENEVPVVLDTEEDKCGETSKTEDCGETEGLK